MFDKILKFGYAMDAIRLFPRLFMGVYIWILAEASAWFLLLDKPSLEQAGYMSVLIGAGIGWFAAYVNSGATKRDKYETTTTTTKKPVDK